MENKHETQKVDRENSVEEDIYSPIEDYQRITSGGPLNKTDVKNIGGLPKGVKFVGLFLIGLLILAMLVAMIFNLFF